MKEKNDIFAIVSSDSNFTPLTTKRYGYKTLSDYFEKNINFFELIKKNKQFLFRPYK